MNKRQKSNITGRIVPIFANNKKKRLKQALYATPSWDDCLELSMMDNVEDFSEHEDFNYFQASEPYPQERSFRQPLQLRNKIGSRANQGDFGHVKDGSDSTAQCQGTRVGTKQVGVPGDVQGANKTLPNTRGTTQGNRIAFNAGNKPRPSQYNTERSAIEGNANKNHYLNDSNRELSDSKGTSSKQVNLMATPSDKSLKVITASIKDVKHWNQFRDKVVAIYEIFGTLNSQVSVNDTGNGKNFVIKDSTGSLGCAFWEMDRKLPRLTRGQMHRCVGSLNRKDGTFNCVSIRPVALAEQKAITSLLQVSGSAMQDHLVALKED